MQPPTRLLGPGRDGLTAAERATVLTHTLRARQGSAATSGPVVVATAAPVIQAGNSWRRTGILVLREDLWRHVAAGVTMIRAPRLGRRSSGLFWS
jgi:hypothetical protein